jgi:hypothetical protein
MVGNAGAGGTAQIHSEIETLRRINFSQRRLRTLGELHYLVGSFFGRSIKLAQMRVGRNHQVTTDVRIEVKNYKGGGTAMQDEILFIVGWVSDGVAKDTRIGLRHINSGGRDVSVSPGTPESFHKKYLYEQGLPTRVTLSKPSPVKPDSR